MRFESVTAHAFGPMTGKTIELAPGMTIIYGPNESGKSSWHAALYAGLCGMRRARGQPRADERDFESRHKPWNGGTWEVGVRIVLADGRRVELRHDLDGRADCRATDLALGRDVSAEIIYEGAPDGSRWLGLDREAFLASACVRQAEILNLRKNPTLLQEHLQRAAATARTDATAAEAIDRLREFHATYVGRGEWLGTGPLGKAVNDLRDAEAQLACARDEHQEYLQLAAQAKESQNGAAALRADLRLLEAAAARRDAETWATRLARARGLASRFPNGPPAPLAEDDELARQVTAAVAGWEGRPRVAELDGESAEELQERIGKLPSIPVGDLEPHADVLGARKASEDADRLLMLHEGQRPSEPATPEITGVTEQELRDLARDLEIPEPVIDPVLEDRLRGAERHVHQLTSRSVAPLVGVGLMGVAGAIGVTVAWGVLAGLLLLVAAGAAVAWMVARANSTRVSALEQLRAAENAAGVARHARDEVARRKGAARARAGAAGLPVDPTGLRSLAARVAEAAQQRRQLGQWAEQYRDLSGRAAAARDALAAALRSRGVSTDGDVAIALQTYLSDCTDRARLAASASQRAQLKSQLAARLAAEEARRRVVEAEGSLRGVARTIGIDGADDEALRQGLREWQIRRAEALQRHQAARDEWTELQILLADQTLDAIEAEATRRSNLAGSLASGLDAAQVSQVSQTGDLDERLAELRHHVEGAVKTAERLRGQMEDRARRLPSVSEAEEDVAKAQRELDRVRRLGRTLESTRQFLELAQERVHRDIAPVLADTLRRWLPKVTADRYTDAIVDPETLKVQVRDPQGHLRDAAILSHGTAEQIYLLLRMALAQHLAKRGETCPLILDDVTAQCDRPRTEAIMRCLHSISHERQVIVFTQEEEILRWAQSHLDRTQDLLIQLEAPGAGT